MLFNNREGPMDLVVVFIDTDELGKLSTNSDIACSVGEVYVHVFW